MMKIHTIVISSSNDSSQIGILPIPEKQLNGMNGNHNHDESHIQVKQNVENKDEKVDNDQDKVKEYSPNHTDHSSDYAYRLLSGKEKLEPSKEFMQNSTTFNKDMEDDDDPYVVPNAAEREEILKSMYNMNQEPIFIPEEVKNRKYKAKLDENPQQSKKQKTSEDETNDNGEENVDLETMLSSFVG